MKDQQKEKTYSLQQQKNKKKETEKYDTSKPIWQYDKSQMYHIVNKLPFIIYGTHVFFLFNI